MTNEDLGQRQYDPTMQIQEAAIDLDLNVKTMSLSTYPGAIHWHLSRDDNPGTIELTWRPDTWDFWMSVHDNRSKDWMKEVIDELKERLASQIQ